MYFYRIECSKFRNLSVDNRSHWCQSELFSLLPVTLLMSQQSIAHVHGIWSKTKYNKGFLDTRRHRRRPAKRKLYKYERQEKKFAMFFVLSAITKNGRVWSEREKKNRLLTRLNFFIICILLNMLAFFSDFFPLPPTIQFLCVLLSSTTTNGHFYSQSRSLIFNAADCWTNSRFSISREKRHWKNDQTFGFCLYFLFTLCCLRKPAKEDE